MDRAAHPTSARGDFRWTGWDLAGPWGIEVLNGDQIVIYDNGNQLPLDPQGLAVAVVVAGP